MDKFIQGQKVRVLPYKELKKIGKPYKDFGIEPPDSVPIDCGRINMLHGHMSELCCDKSFVITNTIGDTGYITQMSNGYYIGSWMCELIEEAQDDKNKTE